jgi:hypothetical protein
MSLLTETLLISEHSSASSPAIQLASFLITVVGKVIYNYNQLYVRGNIAFINVISKVSVSQVFTSIVVVFLLINNRLGNKIKVYHHWQECGSQNFKDQP